MKIATRRVGLAVALLGLIVGAAGQAKADLVVGYDSGVFVNPNPSGSPIVTTGAGGSGSSVFTWGLGDPAPPNKLTYASTSSASNQFSHSTEVPFTLGTLTYFNGTTVSGTVPNTVDMKITLNLSSPGTVSSTSFTFTLALNSTPNIGTPDQNADYVYFPSTLSSTTTTFAGTGVNSGKTYTLKLTGFGNVTGDGFLASSSNELHVREGGTATADLMGVVTTNLTATPEPSTIILACTALPMGLFVARRRRAKSAS